MNLRETIQAARVSGPVRRVDGVVAFEFRFAADDPLFAGHFPNRPLLPGVFQLELARLAAEWVHECRLAVKEITRAKFQRPVLPGDVLLLELKLAENDGMLMARAQFSVDGEAAGETSLKLWRSE